MESQKLPDDSPCESEESSLEASAVLDSEINEIENSDEYEVDVSNDSASKDCSEKDFTSNQIQNCSSNSLAEEHSQNGVSSVNSSLSCSGGTSEAEENEDSNSKHSVEHDISESTPLSGRVLAVLQGSTDSTGDNEVTAQQTSPDCKDPSIFNIKDIDRNTLSATSSEVRLPVNLCDFTKASDKKDGGSSSSKTRTENVGESEMKPVDLSISDSMGIKDSSSEPVEAMNMKSDVETNISLHAYENDKCNSQMTTAGDCKIGDPSSETSSSADDVSIIKADSSSLAKSKSESYNELSQSETKIDSSALDMTISHPILPQNLCLESSERRNVDCCNNVSENHCDPRSPLDSSVKYNEKLCNKIPSTQDQSSSSFSNIDSLVQDVTKCLRESDELAQHSEKAKPAMEEHKSEANDTLSEVSAAPESFVSFVDSVQDDGANSQTVATSIDCGAVDLTKTQINSSAASEQCPSSPISNSEALKKDCKSSMDPDVDLQPLSNEETGLPDFFEDLVTVGKYISVKGDFTLRSSEALIESASLISPFLLKEPDVFPTREQPLKTENKGFFQSAVGEFLIGLGLSRCNEWYYRDMVHMKNRQIRKEGKSPELEEDLKTLQSSYFQAKMANEPYVFSKKTCSSCSFNAESAIVLEGHMLVPHLISHREYKCGFCPYVSRDPKSILTHMKTEHNKVGRIDIPSFPYECPNCMFECNTRVKFGNHLNRCSKYHDHTTVQLPPKDFELPCLTPKPITVAVVKAYEKSISSVQNRYKKPRKGENTFDAYHPHFNQHHDNSRLHSPYESNYNMGLPDGVSAGAPNFTRKSARPAPPSFVGSNIGHLPYPQGNKYFQAASNGSALYSSLSNSTAAASPLSFPFLPNPSPKGASNQSFKGMFQPCLPQPPKLQGPYPVPMEKSMPCVNLPLQSNNLVVCEICDGYIKDMEQLRTHMQLIHKVKIHPKVLSSRPPLNCQKCQWRFFTDQGLERHLLGAHGLVTSNMQDMANKNKDSGCCTICGRVFASKLVIHMSQIHKITLKPAHLSYKCTVCSATFNLYRLFENHVYLVHSSSNLKRSAENSDLQPSKKVARASNWEPSAVREKHSRYLAEKENGAA